MRNCGGGCDMRCYFCSGKLCVDVCSGAKKQCLQRSRTQLHSYGAFRAFSFCPSSSRAQSLALYSSWSIRSNVILILGSAIVQMNAYAMRRWSRDKKPIATQAIDDGIHASIECRCAVFDALLCLRRERTKVTKLFMISFGAAYLCRVLYRSFGDKLLAKRNWQPIRPTDENVNEF